MFFQPTKLLVFGFVVWACRGCCFVMLTSWREQRISLRMDGPLNMTEGGNQRRRDNRARLCCEGWSATLCQNCWDPPTTPKTPLYFALTLHISVFYLYFVTLRCFLDKKDNRSRWTSKAERPCSHPPAFPSTMTWAGEGSPRKVCKLRARR